MNELALFAGAGGGILGGHLLRWRTVCAVEWEPYPASVLVARQNDKILPPFPIWDDVQTFDGHPWRGIVDVVSGGFPCQDISAAGKGEGITGSRSSMWKHMARIISEVRPQFVFVENSPMLTIRGLGVVLGDLSEMGFDAEWGVISAGDIGAPHLRERIWIVARNVANSNCEGGQWEHGIQVDGCSRCNIGQNHAKNAEECGEMERFCKMAHTSMSGLKTRSEQAFGPQQRVLERQLGRIGHEYRASRYNWPSEPNVGRVVNGMASRVDRLKAIGNGQVSGVAATAWTLLNERFNK
jgi:DNA (cytosine-5)-methyltransferase 1